MQRNDLPFPWGTGAGLAPVLADGDAIYMAMASDRHPLREQWLDIIKASARGARGPHGTIKIVKKDDLRSVVTALTALLATPTGRRKLQSSFNKYWRLGNSSYRSHLCDLLANLESIRTLDGKPSDVEELAPWLADRDLDGNTPRIISLYGVIMALRKEDDGPRLVEIIKARDPVFEELLVGATAVAMESETEAASSDDSRESTRGKPAPAMPGVQDRPAVVETEAASERAATEPACERAGLAAVTAKLDELLEMTDRWHASCSKLSRGLGTAEVDLKSFTDEAAGLLAAIHEAGGELRAHATARPETECVDVCGADDDSVQACAGLREFLQAPDLLERQGLMQARNAAAELVATIDRLDSTARAKADELEKLAEQTGSAIETEHVARVTSLGEAARRVEKLDEEIASTRDRLKTLQAEWSTRVQARLGEIKDHFDLEFAASDVKEALAGIRRERTSISSVRGFEQLLTRLDEAERALEKGSSALKLDALAAAAEDADYGDHDVIQLARGLVDRDRSELALVLVTALQSGALEVDTQLGEMDALTRVVLTSIVRAETTLEEHGGWAAALGCMHWFKSLDGSDLEDPGVATCAVIMLALAYESTGDEAFMNAAYQHGLGRLSNHPNLSRLCELTLSNENFTVGDPNVEEDLDAASATIDDALRTNAKGRYVHSESIKRASAMQAANEIIYPEVESCWESIKAARAAHDAKAARAALEACDIETLYDDVVLADHERAANLGHFDRNNVSRVLQRLMDQIGDYVAKVETLVEHGTLIEASGLDRDIDDLESTHPDLGDIWGFVRRSARMRRSTVPAERPDGLRDLLLRLCLGLPAYAHTAPKSVHHLTNKGWDVDGSEVAKSIVKGLRRQLTVEEAIERLESRQCFVQASDLAEASADDPARLGKLRDAATEIQQQLGALIADLSTKADASIDWGAYSRAVELGRFGLTRRALDEITQQVKRRTKSELEGLQRTLQEQRTRSRELSDSAVSGQMAPDWKRRFQSIVTRIDAEIVDSQISALDVGELSTRTTEIERALDTLALIVRERSQGFDLIDARFLDGSVQASAFQPAAESPAGDVSDVPPERRGLHETWGRFREVTRAEQDEWDLWKHFLEDMAATALLVKSEASNETIKGLQFMAWRTRFHAKRKGAIRRPLELILLAGKRPTTGHLTSLNLHIAKPEDDPPIRIVFVPGDAEKVRTKLSGEVVLVDTPIFEKLICSRESFGFLQRTIIQQGVEKLPDPFTSEGPVSEGSHVFVKRQNEARTLAESRASMRVVGGRRIGKTSLLHHVRRLIEQRSPKTLVGYQSFQSLRDELDDGQDPNLLAARWLAESIGLPTPASLQDFHTSLRDTLREHPVVFLIDEVDTYILAAEGSPHEDGSPRFGLFRILRGLAQDVAMDLRVIVAGFKDLHRQMNARRPADTNFPWQNFFEELPRLGQLRFDQVRRLVNLGFETMLGIELDPGVEEAIFEKASGHPAFVQKFCQELIDVARRRIERGETPTLTEEDVEGIYRRDEESAEKKVFISFVNETLDLNVDRLEKIILLVFCVDIDPASPDGIPEKELRQSVQDYWDIGTVDQNTWNEAIINLEMTGMIETGNDRIRIAFPTYADIMRRLGEADKSSIFNLIEEYRQSPR